MPRGVWPREGLAVRYAMETCPGEGEAPDSGAEQHPGEDIREVVDAEQDPIGAGEHDDGATACRHPPAA